MCYNAAKNWQIGWYNDRKVLLNPKSESAITTWSKTVTMVGIADYVNIANIPVVVKLETDTMNDYFIAFNRAMGINADNAEASNKVSIVQTDGGDGESEAQSWLRATLQVGEQLVISNFGGSGRNCIIKFVSMDKPGNGGPLNWLANVQVTMNGPPTQMPSTSNPTTKYPTRKVSSILAISLVFIV